MRRLFQNKTTNLLVIGCICTLGCSRRDHKPLSETEAAIEWGRMDNYITRFTPSNSPTYASRAFGYIGLCMYESVVNGYPSYNSLAGQLNGLGELPKPDPSKSYSWILAFNSGQAAILKDIYQQTSDENKVRIDSLEEVVFEQFSDTIDRETAERSVQYGRAIAAAIYDWSKTDGGHRAYLRNFDKKMVFTERPGSWKPPLYSQAISHYPLHPHWGNNRTFVKKNRELPDPKMLPYDTVPGSPYYEEFLKVYKKERELTQKEKETAIWWGDDPDVTFTPPGHSFYIATVALDLKKPGLIKVAETYAKTGMAVADAFIKCWEWKYYFFSERANTYVPKFIDPDWVSFWPDPPFPAFPSGHAIQAAAAATVLEGCFGPRFKFTDRAHEGRPRDEVRNTDFVIRSFDNFWQAAQETADSRFYGGIHTPLDNEVGLENGKRIARNVLGLNWKKS